MKSSEGKEYDKNRNPIHKLAPREFPYKSLKDPKYIKDRNKVFRKNGNGWWLGTGAVRKKTNFTRK